MKTVIDAMADHTMVVKRVIDQLDRYAAGFCVTGNLRMEENLAKLCTDLETSTSQLDLAVGKEIHDQAKAADKSARATVQAALLGAMGRFNADVEPLLDNEEDETTIDKKILEDLARSEINKIS